VDTGILTTMRGWEWKHPETTMASLGPPRGISEAFLGLILSYTYTCRLKICLEHKFKHVIIFLMAFSISQWKLCILRLIVLYFLSRYCGTSQIWQWVGHGLSAIVTGWEICLDSEVSTGTGLTTTIFNAKSAQKGTRKKHERYCQTGRYRQGHVKNMRDIVGKYGTDRDVKKINEQTMR
jgi:hypothetical protein